MCLLLFVYVGRGFSDGCALVSSKFSLGLMAGVWMDGFLVLMTILAFCLGCFLVGAGEVFCLLSAI